MRSEEAVEELLKVVPCWRPKKSEIFRLFHVLNAINLANMSFYLPCTVRGGYSLRKLREKGLLKVGEGCRKLCPLREMRDRSISSSLLQAKKDKSARWVISFCKVRMLDLLRYKFLCVTWPTDLNLLSTDIRLQHPSTASTSFHSRGSSSTNLGIPPTPLPLPSRSHRRVPSSTTVSTTHLSDVPFYPMGYRLIDLTLLSTGNHIQQPLTTSFYSFRREYLIFQGVFLLCGVAFDTIFDRFLLPSSVPSSPTVSNSHFPIYSGIRNGHNW